MPCPGRVITSLTPVFYHTFASLRAWQPCCSSLYFPYVKIPSVKKRFKNKVLLRQNSITLNVFLVQIIKSPINSGSAFSNPRMDPHLSHWSCIPALGISACVWGYGCASAQACPRREAQTLVVFVSPTSFFSHQGSLSLEQRAHPGFLSPPPDHCETCSAHPALLGYSRLGSQGLQQAICPLNSLPGLRTFQHFLEIKFWYLHIESTQCRFAK